MSSMVTNSARFSRPKLRKSICRGLLYDLMTPSNPNGTRSAARIPKMLACIFSAPHVAFARLYSEGA